jgi:glutathione synthase/RimK-type ligase-like ATP-grasp enzyme
MSSHLIIVEKAADWRSDFPQARVVTAKDYLAEPEYFALSNAKIINLCRSYRYLSQGYYCSLLAEARHHRVIPTVRTLRDLSSKAIYRLNINYLDDLLQETLSRRQASWDKQNAFEIQVFFGQCELPELARLAQRIFATFTCPLLKIEFRFTDQWNIHAIRSMHLDCIEEKYQTFFIKALNAYTLRKTSVRARRRAYLYDLAILHNPHEELPPSDAETLEKFIKIGRKMDIDVDLIHKRDYARLAEYDALFIRETTAIAHHTYRFAKKAESEGMAVIDDPDSILRCTNKVYLAELLKAHKIPTPKTLILYKGLAYTRRVESELAYPLVLKIPDGSFSRGVYKANDRAELSAIAKTLFKESDIILAQEYLYTAYDWRIGIINGKPIFASQYFMSDAHWQIVKHEADGGHTEGTFKTVAIGAAPEKVVKTALKAAQHIGAGLYGVDLKETARGVVVIEVNDNPNIDEGVENAVLGDELYRIILGEFIRRINAVKK